jgi:hypothetical protein
LFFSRLVLLVARSVGHVFVHTLPPSLASRLTIHEKPCAKHVLVQIISEQRRNSNRLPSFCAGNLIFAPAEPKLSRVMRHVQMRQLDLSKFKKFTRSIRQKEIQIVKEQK